VELVASTYTFLWRAEIDAAVGEIAKAGFHRVELLAAPPHVDASEWQAAANRIGAACRRAGVSVHSVAPSGVDVNLASPDSTMREWSVGYFATIGRLAADVGARWLIIHSGRRHPLRPAPYGAYQQWVIDGVRRVLDEMSELEIGVLFENTPTGILDTGEEIAQLIERVDSNVLRVCYDVANGHMVEDVHAGLTAAGRYLGLVHLSDTTKAAWAHDPIGAGELDFERLAETVAGIGYGGEFVLETLHDGDVAEGFSTDLATLQQAGWLTNPSTAGRQEGSREGSVP
jgi:sugar phosphate isomerase/epimerase